MLRQIIIKGTFILQIKSKSVKKIKIKRQLIKVVREGVSGSGGTFRRILSRAFDKGKRAGTKSHSALQSLDYSFGKYWAQHMLIQNE